MTAAANCEESPTVALRCAAGGAAMSSSRTAALLVISLGVRPASGGGTPRCVTTRAVRAAASAPYSSSAAQHPSCPPSAA